MSEMAEDFNALKKLKQEKRADNRQASAEILKTAGVRFISNNGGAHLIVEAVGHYVDFWPGTGKWITRRPGRQSPAAGCVGC